MSDQEIPECKDCEWFERTSRSYAEDDGICLAACAGEDLLEGSDKMCDPGRAFYRAKKELEQERLSLNRIIRRLKYIGSIEVNDDAMGEVQCLLYDLNIPPPHWDEECCKEHRSHHQIITIERLEQFLEWEQKNIFDEKCITA